MLIGDNFLVNPSEMRGIKKITDLLIDWGGYCSESHFFAGRKGARKKG
jgi:hypothetical protein